MKFGSDKSNFLIPTRAARWATHQAAVTMLNSFTLMWVGHPIHFACHVKHAGASYYLTTKHPLIRIAPSRMFVLAKKEMFCLYLASCSICKILQQKMICYQNERLGGSGAKMMIWPSNPNHSKLDIFWHKDSGSRQRNVGPCLIFGLKMFLWIIRLSHFLKICYFSAYYF